MRSSMPTNAGPLKQTIGRHQEQVATLHQQTVGLLERAGDLRYSAEELFPTRHPFSRTADELEEELEQLYELAPDYALDRD